MEYQRRPSTISTTHSFSDTDLDTAGTDFDDAHYYIANDFDAASQRFSTPLILISPGMSVTNSTSSIPSLAAVTTNSTQNSTGSPPPLLLSPNDGKDNRHPRNFTLDLNSSDTTDGNDQASPPDDFLPLDATSLDRGSRNRTCEVYQSRYENKLSLAQDLVSLSTMPEFCDVTFLVGEGRQPVCGVRAILAARSRYVCVSGWLSCSMYSRGGWGMGRSQESIYHQVLAEVGREKNFCPVESGLYSPPFLNSSYMTLKFTTLL